MSKAVVIDTTDGTIEIEKSLFFSESAYVRDLFSASSKRVNIDIPFTYAAAKLWLEYVENLQPGPPASIQDAVEIYPIASFLQMENMVGYLLKYMDDTVTDDNLVAVYHSVVELAAPLPKMLWTKIIKRFRMLYLNRTYLDLTDAEFALALEDPNLNIKAMEEWPAITEWLNGRVTDHKMVTEIKRRVGTVPITEGVLLENTFCVRSRTQYTLIVSIGGTQNNGSPSSAISSYVERTNCWKPSPGHFQSDAVRGHGAVVVRNKLLVYGGSHLASPIDLCSALDLTTGAWSRLANMNERRTKHGATLMTTTEGAQYAIALGGFNGTESLKSGEMYEFESKSWTKIPDLTHKRSDLAATVVDGKLFAVGGFDGNDELGKCEVIDYGAANWTKPLLTGSMRTVRRGCAAVTHDRRVVVALDGRHGGTRLRSAEFYDTREGFWHLLPCFTYARCNLGATIVDEHVYIAGGTVEPGKPSERLDLRANVWEMIAPLSDVNRDVRLVTLENCALIGQLVDFMQESPTPPPAVPIIEQPQDESMDGNPDALNNGGYYGGFAAW